MLFKSENKKRKEKRERVKKNTEKKILSIVLAGLIGLGGGFGLAKGTGLEEIGRSLARKTGISMAERETAKPPENIKEAELDIQEQIEFLEVKEVIKTLEEKVDKHGYLMRLIAQLQELPAKKFISTMRMTPETKDESPEISVSNLEKAGIKSEVLAEMVKAVYPSSWLRHIEKIEFVENTSAIDTRAYGKNFQGPLACGRVFRPLSRKSAIEFYNGCESRSIPYYLNHELAHTIDWDKNQVLSVKDRMLFLKKVLERIGADDRFLSGYVEKIDVPDEKLKNNTHATEYWAEIMEEYLNRPPYYFNGGRDPGRLALKDVELIEDFLKKTDPQFDAKRANHRRFDFTATHIDQYGERPPLIYIHKSKI